MLSFWFNNRWIVGACEQEVDAAAGAEGPSVQGDGRDARFRRPRRQVAVSSRISWKIQVNDFEIRNKVYFASKIVFCLLVSCIMSHLSFYYMASTEMENILVIPDIISGLKIYS